MTKETAYCGECGRLAWIQDVVTDTAAPGSNDVRVPPETRQRRVLLECRHVVNVISRHISR